MVPLEGQEDEFQTLVELFYNRNEMHNFCFVDDETPVLMVGLKEKWANVYDSYTVFSPTWNPVFYKKVIRIAKGYLDKLDYDRIEHLAHCDRPWTDRMLKAFGFQYNTTLENYIGGKDFKLYEIVNGRS